MVSTDCSGDRQETIPTLRISTNIARRIRRPLILGTSRARPENRYHAITDMLKRPEFGVGFTERRDSFELYKIPYYEDISGVAPCGAIVSNIEDMSHWLIALMNQGKYNGKQVLPVLRKRKRARLSHRKDECIRHRLCHLNNAAHEAGDILMRRGIAEVALRIPRPPRF